MLFLVDENVLFVDSFSITEIIDLPLFENNER